MSLEVDLPHALEHEIRSQAECEGLSLEDHVVLVLELSTILLHEGAQTPLRRAVNEFFAKRSIPAYQVAEVLRELLRLAIDHNLDTNPGHSTEATDVTIDTVSILERALEAYVRIPPKPRVSGLGKFDHIPFSSEDFAREKQEELVREEAKWERFRSESLEQ